ncbi:MAG: hypothetical protein WDW36_006823 [Sanguina aurantia]
MRRFHERYSKLLQQFAKSPSVRETALKQYISEELFKRTMELFKRFLSRGVDARTTEYLAHHVPTYTPQYESLLLSYYLPYMREEHAAEILLYTQKSTSLDLREPHTWYPFARALKRKIIYHAGPTNSGKTYNALQALKSCETGLYCGPLRLLALEAYDTLNAAGVWCSLMTGEEQREVPGAGHVACTVEMAPINRRWDVAVVDEIQMLGDESRGSAWTRAVLGLPANELHLCGDGSSLELVKTLCRATGEDLQVIHYDRFCPLNIDFEGLPGGLGDVKAGDCIVAFSKKAIFNIKAEIEFRTPHKVCVIYGQLPPETRRHQARLFNDADSGYDVLVASDAVGMGLNLNIRRVVFHSLSKPGRGFTYSPLSVSAVKQIAGRAGRRSSQYNAFGLATCANPRDLASLKASLDTPMQSMITPRAGLQPEYEQVELLAMSMPGASLKEVLARFASDSRLDGSFFFCDLEDSLAVAETLDQIPELTLKERYQLCLAPANISRDIMRDWLLFFATQYAAGTTVFHPTFDMAQLQPLDKLDKLFHLEQYNTVITLWLWLSYRMPNDTFPGRSSAQAHQTCIIDAIDDTLLDK